MYIIGTGTFVNTGAIIAGGLLGYLFQRWLTDRIQNTLMQAIGIAVIFIGIAGTLSRMLVIHNDKISSQGIMMAVISLAIGSLIGEIINIEARFLHFGMWLKVKAGRKNDSKFIDGFVTASLTVCIGAMAIIGPLQDALSHDPTMLFTKAILDGVIVAIYASAFGIGPIFSSIPVLILQGSVTLLAVVIQRFLTTSMTNGISLVGSMMITCVGINLLFPNKIKVANMLPALVIVIFYAAAFG